MAHIEQFRYIERTPSETVMIIWHMYSLDEIRDHLNNRDLRDHLRNRVLLQDLEPMFAEFDINGIESGTDDSSCES